MSDADDLPRWSPDELLVPAILAGSPTVMSDLSLADRAWAVLQLKDLGYTAEFTAERLDCSVRLVRSIIADDLGQVMRRYIDQSETNTRESVMTAAEVKRLAAELAAAEAARDRYHGQLTRLLDDRREGRDPVFRKCGCPKTRYNTYIHPKTGKASCRYHRRLAQRRYEQRRRETGTAPLSA
ncbi:HNH endonuclease [Mycobacterium phage Thonko]|uniref:HNH endonuclease n=1 Tax=Mycobacterium phage Thonko TaxID=2282910 RepID=A0A346FCC6_9CAUD|nr:HNH endonuclease [Mycobacterium phage Thonko]AXN53351.1 HNH endonuclease [Mycobacterium phage Thonko]